MEEEVQTWYYMADGQQVGPISGDDLQQLAMNGTVHAETELWTEGLDQWIPATHVEGLLPAEPAPQADPAQPGQPHLVVGAAAQVAHPLAGEVVPQAVQSPQMTAAPAAGGVQFSGYEQAATQAPGAPMAGPVPPGMEYPPTGTKRASFGLLVGLLIGAIVVGVGGFAFSVSVSSRGPDSEDSAALLLLATFGTAAVLLLISSILCYVYLYRAWNCLRFGDPRTTAGKAIGFLFIPFFNIYWIFVAIYGLAQDWNRITASYPNIQKAPRLSEGMFLTYLICSLVVAPLGIIFWFVVYKQMCDGINFMATQNLRQQQPAGMSFY